MVWGGGGGGNRSLQPNEPWDSATLPSPPPLYKIGNQNSLRVKFHTGELFTSKSRSRSRNSLAHCLQSGLAETGKVQQWSEGPEQRDILDWMRREHARQKQIATQITRKKRGGAEKCDIKSLFDNVIGKPRTRLLLHSRDQITMPVPWFWFRFG
jgi:hypothetical protein